MKFSEPTSARRSSATTYFAWYFGSWTYLRVPYPLGFYQRGLDGRIDDPSAGWKGRGLYANYGTHLVWHIEGGKGTTGKIVKFQIRPDPMAH